MNQDKILYEVKDNVATIWLNDPITLNAITVPMCTQLSNILDLIAASARAMVITGAGRGFCSGANLSGDLGRAKATDSKHSLDIGIVLEEHINPLMKRLSALPIPWVSAIRGGAAGFGAALAIAADIVVASDNAYFLQPFANIGLVPDSGATWLLTRAIGRNRAMELLLLGERLPAAKAYEWGLVNRLTSDEELESTAHDIAHRLATGPTRTFSMIRKAVWAATDNDWATAMETERQLQRDAGRTADFTEGRMAFLEKRAARFTGG